MVGWICSCFPYLESYTVPANVNDIAFMDINRPFMFYDYMGDFSYDGLNLFSELENYFGNDVNLLNAFPQTGISNIDMHIINEFPSIKASFPNTFEYLSKFNNTQRIRYCLYFPTLRKLIFFRYNDISSGGNIVNFRDVDDNGNIAKTPFYKVPTSPGYGLSWLLHEIPNSGQLVVPLIVSSKKEDLLKSTNYYALNLYWFKETNYGGITRYVPEFGAFDQTVNNNALAALFKDYVEPDVSGEPFGPLNPYEPGGVSGTGDTPPGTFDETSNPIPDSPLPTLSAANTGFTRIYNPTLSQVQDLARYLWTDETVIQTIWNHIKQYFEDPMQAIIGFNLVPCSVPNAGTQNFSLMYIDTGVSMNVAANQFVDVDCGSVKLERFYGSALDQSPNTRVSCFLPYIGTIRLNTDEVMGTTLEVKYRIDICSGSCVAKILVDGNCLYQYSGHCAINIPISSADFSSYVSSAITVARLATGAAVGGISGLGAAAVSDPEQQTDRVVTVDRTTTTTKRNPATGRQITTGTRRILETKTIPMRQSHTQASFNALSPENVSNTVGQIMSSKPSIEHTGSFSGNTGYLGVRRPFLIIERPNMCMPEQYQHFNGFPAMITMELSTCKGFTRIQQVELTGMTATNPEQAEILSILKSGVYF